MCWFQHILLPIFRLPYNHIVTSQQFMQSQFHIWWAYHGFSLYPNHLSRYLLSFIFTQSFLVLGILDFLGIFINEMWCKVSIRKAVNNCPECNSLTYGDTVVVLAASCPNLPTVHTPSFSVYIWDPSEDVVVPSVYGLDCSANPFEVVPSISTCLHCLLLLLTFF